MLREPHFARRINIYCVRKADRTVCSLTISYWEFVPFSSLRVETAELIGTVVREPYHPVKSNSELDRRYDFDGRRIFRKITRVRVQPPQLPRLSLREPYRTVRCHGDSLNDGPRRWNCKVAS